MSLKKFPQMFADTNLLRLSVQSLPARAWLVAWQAGAGNSITGSTAANLKNM